MTERNRETLYNRGQMRPPNLNERLESYRKENPCVGTHLNLEDPQRIHGILHKHYVTCDERYNDHRSGYDYFHQVDPIKHPNSYYSMYVEFKDDEWGDKHLGKNRYDMDDEVLREYED